jgi:hypothetical protein
VDQQQRMRDALTGFANHISSSARQENATWPMYRLPDFELHAGSRRLEAGVEIVVFSPNVEPKDVEEYLEFVTANYEDVVNEAHMIRYGNTNRLNPVGYTPNFQLVGPTGYFPDPQSRQFRGPIWQLSPRKLFFMFFSVLISIIFVIMSISYNILLAPIHVQHRQRIQVSTGMLSHFLILH